VLKLVLRLIRVKLVLKYRDEWRPGAIYRACLRDAVVEPKSGVKARVIGNKILLLIKGSKSSKVAERLKNILGLIHMVEQAITILETQDCVGYDIFKT